MKVGLLYQDRNLDLQQPLPPQAQMLMEDLGLGVLFGAMAGEDPLLLEVAEKVMLASLLEPQEILYRQAVLQDCLGHPATIREIYGLAVEALLKEKKSWFLFRDSPSSILHRSLEVLQMFVESLKKLRKLADRYAAEFSSEGFRRLFAMLQEELSDDYFAVVEGHLRELHFPRGQLMSAQLGQGNKGIRYILRRPHDAQQSWWQRLRAPKVRSYSFSIDPRDEGGLEPWRSYGTAASIRWPARWLSPPITSPVSGPCCVTSWLFTWAASTSTSAWNKSGPHAASLNLLHRGKSAMPSGNSMSPPWPSPCRSR